MNSSQATPLHFPCLLALGTGLISTTKKEIFHYWIDKHLHENMYLARHGNWPKLKLLFVIDRLGNFRPVHHIKTRRQYLAFFSPIYDFVQSECEIEPGLRLACGDLLDRISFLKQQHASCAGNFKRFLKNQLPEHMFDEKLFRDYWDHYGPELPASEWGEDFP